MSIGDKLKNARHNLGKTCEEVSSDLGIARSSLTMYETNRRVPKDSIKKRISNYFGISIEDLFF